MRIAVVHDGSEVATLAAVRAAAPEADVVEVDVTADPHADGLVLAVGDAVLRIGSSLPLRAVEDGLRGAGVACLSPPISFHTIDLPTFWKARGLAVRPEVPLAPLARDATVGHAERLGGFPLGVRILEASGRSDLVRVDSVPALVSTLDLVHETAGIAMLGAWDERPVLWRVLLAGGRAIAAGKRIGAGPDWYGPGGAVTRVPARRDVVALAAAALRALDAPLGTVDLMERRDTTLALLHAEAPPPLPEIAAWAEETALAAVVTWLVRRAEEQLAAVRSGEPAP